MERSTLAFDAAESAIAWRLFLKSEDKVILADAI